MISSVVSYYLMIAVKLTSFTYGYQEDSCYNGSCIVGVSRTASGELLRNDVPSAAIPLPKNVIIKPFWIAVKTKNGSCTKIKINDKASPKLIGKRGFDLSPAALAAIIGKANRYWSGQLFLCDIESKENKEG